MDAAITSAIEGFEIQQHYNPLHGDVAARRISDLLYDRVLQVAPLIKHPAFIGEREWRLISPVRHNDAVKIRVGRYSHVPYGDFPITINPGGTCLRTVVVGPGPHQYRAMQGLHALVSACEQDGRKLGLFNVKPSQTPYIP